MCCQNKNKGAAQARTYPSPTTATYALVSRTGTTQKFGSRLEADAANADIGYSGIVKPVGS